MPVEAFYALCFACGALIGAAGIALYVLLSDSKYDKEVEGHYYHVGIKDYADHITVVDGDSKEDHPDDYLFDHPNHPGDKGNDQIYPSGIVYGPCVCGSWPGGKCLKCQVVAAKGYGYKKSGE